MGARFTGWCLSRSAFFRKNPSWLSCSHSRIRAEESRPFHAPTPGASGRIRWVCGWRQAAGQGECQARGPELPLGPGLLLPAGSLTRPCFLDMRPGCLSLGCHSWTRSEPPHAAHSLTQSLTHCFPWKTPSEEKLPIPDTITHTPLMSSQQRRLPHGHGRSQGQGKSQCVSTHGLAHSAGSRKHVEPWQQLARQATKAFGG